MARALRESLIGQVHLLDMQLDINVDELYQQLIAHRPDIIGISVTFGQQDIVETLLERHMVRISSHQNVQKSLRQGS